MANRRTFAKNIIDSDAFLDMPSAPQNLYFHLVMRADDDGFIDNANRIMRIISCSREALDYLIMRKFVAELEGDICIILHWRIHNYIQNDRYKPTIYLELSKQIVVDEADVYSLVTEPDTECIQTSIQTLFDLIQNRVPSIGSLKSFKELKDLKTIQNHGHEKKKAQKAFAPPTIDDVRAYCAERGKKVDPDLWLDHYTANGWKVGKNPMKDWKAAVRTWERSSVNRPPARQEISRGITRHENVPNPVHDEWFDRVVLGKRNDSGGG